MHNKKKKAKIMQSWENIHISASSVFPQLPALPAGSFAQSLPQTKSSVPHF